MAEESDNTQARLLLAEVMQKEFADALTIRLLRDPSYEMSLLPFAVNHAVLAVNAALSRPVDSSLRDAMVEPRRLMDAEVALMGILSAQKVQPYNGWDLDQLNAAVKRADEYVNQHLRIDDKNEVHDILLEVWGARLPGTDRGWSMTQLNAAADSGRSYFGLPTIRELNPDIAAMQDTVRSRVKENEGSLSRFKGLSATPFASTSEADKFGNT